jgi:hypothetical protein
MKTSSLILASCLCASAVYAGQQAISPADRTVTLSNIKQASIALLMYTQDYDNLYPNPPTMSRLKTVVFPYLKTQAVWTTKNPSGGEFLMNDAIKGTNMNSIPNPGQVVALYESKAWPDGLRAVGFVDGHCKNLSKEDWTKAEQTLRLKFPKKAKPLPK